MNRRDFLKAGMGSVAFAAAVRPALAAVEAKKNPVDLGPIVTNYEIRTCPKKMNRVCAFFIDDVIWCLRDIARERPKSIFDNPFMAGLKRAHDMYGLKVQLNLFYRTDYFYGMDEFTLADMPDSYKAQWQDNADWIKFGFHALQEFPDYPFVNVSYADVKKLNGMISGEVARFAGNGMYATAVVPHWGPMSKEGCKALADSGMKVMWVSNGPRYAYDGNPDSLPYGHSFRLLNNRKPETALYWRGTRNAAINSSISCYNHLPTDLTELTRGSFKTVYDRDTGISFKKFSNGPCLNLYPLDTIVPAFNKVLGKELIIHGNHEQYFFKDYFAYQPDYMEKVLVSAKWMKDNGYSYIFIEDAVG